MSEKKLKGVLFDFNGTLFFDSYLHIRAFEICFAKRGMSVPSAEFIVTNIFGISNENIYKTFFDPNATKDECLRFAEEKEGLYRSMCLENPSLMKYTEGACELMRYLKKNSVPYCLATGSGMDNISFYNECMELEKWFDRAHIVCGDDNVKGKPDPEIYEYAASKIGLMASECIVFEDGTKGLIAANKANAGASIAIYEEGLPSPLINGARADAVYHDFTEWKDILHTFGL